MKGILILFFWYLIILLFIIMCVILGHSQNFPVADIGDCYRGVSILDDYYKNMTEGIKRITGRAIL